MKRYYVLLLMVVYALAGCSQSAENQKGSGSVAAIVNGVEITKKQVDYLYKRAAYPGISARDSINLKRRIAGDLVARELLAGKARQMRLDKGTDFAMERYSLEKRALASLAEKELIDKKLAVSDKDAQFVVQNYPALFANRKLYVYDRVLMKAPDSLLIISLDKMIKNGARVDQLVGQLQTSKIPYNKAREVAPTEKLPQVLQPLIVKLKPGVPEIVIFPNKNSVILEVNQAIPVPLEGVAARRAAASMIASLRRGDLMQKQMKELLDSSEITYFDEYLNTGVGEQNVAQLPVPDKERAAKKVYQRVRYGAIFALLFVLAIMTLIAGIRTLYDKSWFFWLKSNEGDVVETEDKYSVRYVAPIFRQLYIFAIFGAILYCIFKDAQAMRVMLPLSMLFASMAGGIVFGALASLFYKTESALNWSRKTYTIVATLLALPVLVLTFFIRYVWLV